MCKFVLALWYIYCTLKNYHTKKFLSHLWSLSWWSVQPLMAIVGVQFKGHWWKLNKFTKTNYLGLFQKTDIFGALFMCFTDNIFCWDDIHRWKRSHSRELSIDIIYLKFGEYSFPKFGLWKPTKVAEDRYLQITCQIAVPAILLPATVCLPAAALGSCHEVACS